MIRLLGYNIYDKSKGELVDYIFNKEEKIHVVSGNPEVLYQGIYNKDLLDNFNDESSVIIPDGIGVIVSAKMLKNNFKEKIAGVELMDSILERCDKEKKSVYLLGAKENVVEKCKININLKYPNAAIVGFHDGYFDIDNCEDIIKDIKACKPYAIFVAMGCPRQEKFIIKYMKELPCSIFMGVGGSFDIMAGESNRAPKWMIDMGLEWLYRVSKEPWRIKRLGSIPKFIFKAITYKES